MAHRYPTASSNQVVLTLRPRSILTMWVALTAVLAALSTAEFLVRRAVQESFSTSEMFFYLDTEGNISVWVSCFGLATLGILSGLIARARRIDGTATLYWVLAAAGFTFLSADEMCQYHEHLTDPLWIWLQASHLTMGGYLRNAWVVPVLVLLPFVVAAFVPFLRALGGRNRFRLAVAAAVYLWGAVGMDMVSGREYYEAHGFSMTLLVLVTIEEVLELLGQGLFLYALLAYLAELQPLVRFGADPT